MAVVNQIIYSVKEIDFIVYSEKKNEIAYSCIYVCTDLEDRGLKFDCKCCGTLREWDGCFSCFIWDEERRYCYTYSLVPVTYDKIEENQ